jgi:hypothetical protein
MKRPRDAGGAKPYTQWKAFLHDHQGVIPIADILIQDVQRRGAGNYHDTKKAATYASKNTVSKASCKYGQYRDAAGVVKCIRNVDHHALEHGAMRGKAHNQYTKKAKAQPKQKAVPRPSLIPARRSTRVIPAKAPPKQPTPKKTVAKKSRRP